MYGGIVGLVRQAIPRGGLLSTRNVQHDASGFGPKVGEYSWTPPDVSAWSSRTFDGYHRADGQVGERITGFNCVCFNEAAAENYIAPYAHKGTRAVVSP